MGKLIDLTGQRFGRLVALKYLGKSRWLCKCDCGNKKPVYARELRSGDTRSCGCLRSPSLIGLRFGKLTVLERVGKSKRRYSLWLCLCDCGNKKYIQSSKLKNGTTKSCGCLRRNDVIGLMEHPPPLQ